MIRDIFPCKFCNDQWGNKNCLSTCMVQGCPHGPKDLAGNNIVLQAYPSLKIVVEFQEARKKALEDKYQIVVGWRS